LSGGCHGFAPSPPGDRTHPAGFDSWFKDNILAGVSISSAPHYLLNTKLPLARKSGAKKSPFVEVKRMGKRPDLSLFDAGYG
jgi:hypothetical protein